MRDHYSEVFRTVKKVLIIVAHPDDMEMIAGGTVARLEQDGKEVRLLVCTDGSLGSRDKNVTADKLAEIRRKEQLKATDILGIPKNEIFILPNKDCSLTENDEALIERLVFHMRSFRPDLIVTHYFETVIENIEPDFLWVSHRDHRAVGVATLNAIMPMSRDSNFFPKHKDLRLKSLKSIEVYKLLIPDLVKGKVIIDIQSVIEKKRAALKAHKSQINDSYAEEIIQEHNLYFGQKGKQPQYVEKFRYYELGYNPKRKEYEEVNGN